MAKQKESQPPTPGKMTIMLIQLEGNDATLQEGIRTFKEAMGRTMFQMVPRAQLPQAAIGALPAASIEKIGDGHNNCEVHEYADDTVVVDSPASAPSAPAKPSTQRQFPRMTLEKDLDLRPTDKPHLKALLEEKKPKDQNEKITLCLYYLRRVLGLENATANHVYTCMEDAKIRLPNDLPQTIRNIANRKGWIDASSSSALEITTKGINLIQHDLPRVNGA